MKPYYDEDGITIYHGDCAELAPALGEFDLIVTDPPYGKEYQSNRWMQGGFDVIEGDEDGAAVVGLLVDLVRNNLRRYRHAYVFGPLDLSPLVAEGLVQEPVELIWDKEMLGMGDLALPWASSHEAIQFLVGVKSRANVKKGEGKLAARLRRGSVLLCQRINAAATVRHPTEKPVRLLRELIESSSCMDDSVFDPFMGVGSTLVAAKLEGRTATGIEIREDYCAEAVRRLV